MKNARRLLDIMARLRDPEIGCPWNVQQDFVSLVPCTLEDDYCWPSVHPWLTVCQRQPTKTAKSIQFF